MDVDTKRDLITIWDLTTEEIHHLLGLAGRLKADMKAGRPHRWLAGKTMAMIFEKPSLRTRVTFETGMNQLGGQAIYLGPSDILLGRRESVADIGKNLSLWVDMILARTFLHDSVVKLAGSAQVPVINGLSDLYHPCQVLADCFTLTELRDGLVEECNRLQDEVIEAAGEEFNLNSPKQLQHILCHYGIVETARMGRAAMITKIHSDDSKMLSELLTVPAPIR